MGRGKKLEGISWSDEIKAVQVYPESPISVVAEVFFATNDDKTYPNDHIKLATLLKSIKNLLKNGFKINLLCIGETDYRGAKKYNEGLGLRRAISVKKHIESQIQNNNLKVTVDSKGEWSALQPKQGIPPPLPKITKDRKVVVKIDTKGCTPPVRLAFVDNWKRIISLGLQNMEKKDGGKIGLLRSSSNWKVIDDEQKIGKVEDNPYLATVVIKANFFTKEISNTHEIGINCVVFHKQIPYRMLFTASAHTYLNIPLSIVEQHHPEGRVIRTLYSEDQIIQGYIIEERIIKSGDLVNRVRLLIEDIYRQLKGGKANITKRAETALGH